MNCAGETGDSQLSPYYHHPLEYSFRRAFLNFNLAWKNNTGRISLTINEVIHLALMQYQYKSTKNKKNPTEKPTFLMWQKETSTQIKLLLLQRRLIFWLNSNPAHAHRKAWKQQLLKSKQRNDMWDVVLFAMWPTFLFATGDLFILHFKSKSLHEEFALYYLHPSPLNLNEVRLSSRLATSHINQLSVLLINTATVHDSLQNLIYSEAVNEMPFTAGVTAPSAICVALLALNCGALRCVTQLEWVCWDKVTRSNKHILSNGHTLKCFKWEPEADESLRKSWRQVPPSASWFLQTASAEVHLMQVLSTHLKIRKQPRAKSDHTVGSHYCKFALNYTVNLLVYFVSQGVRLLCKWSRLCLNLICPQENCNELSLVSGTLSITISHLAVESIIALVCLAACNYLLIWSAEPSS